MAIIKCKMCGGDLELVPDSTVCECAYCGTRQTVPSADSEKMLSLFHRAGKLLRACEFDKAYGVYESIIAEFPDEAEAYWGLVLCKFGIEYVDDPATGKKVPTCHRSSFESIFEDENFEQACENADDIARRVYREEAKAIEELRKGIIEVSAKEEPYDIFISYKELSDDGDRTLDSVIAQDIYTELTDKGYRVFFSRISLEDKLGTEYEPYIFAALQSAKVMLVVGTDYEHFNAVWVKNEWSRFLALMASGQKKTLIPVFKDIDAYDMPREFNKLAAQDMGKVGAMQDLLRGVEKIISPKKEASVPAAAQVVMSGGPNVIALQKRGQMALEDGQWDAAKDFFNQVLNMDAECAEAYLGLALAEDHSSTDAEYIQKHTSAELKNIPQTIAPDQARAEEAARIYAVPDFLSEDVIRAAFRYDVSYTSYVQSARELLKRETQQFEQNRNLARAARFAGAETAERIQAMRIAVADAWSQHLAAAMEEDRTNRDQKEADYQTFLSSIEERVEKMHAKAKQKAEEHAEAEKKAAAEALERERREKEQKAAAEKAKAEYQAFKKAERKTKLEAEKAALTEELSHLRGLFAGKRRAEIETRLETIDAMLKSCL